MSGPYRIAGDPGDVAVGAYPSRVPGYVRLVLSAWCGPDDWYPFDRTGALLSRPLAVAETWRVELIVCGRRALAAIQGAL